MVTQYFARPKLQIFGVSTAFVVRKIGPSDLREAQVGRADFANDKGGGDADDL